MNDISKTTDNQEESYKERTVRFSDATDEVCKEKTFYFDEAITLTGSGRYHNTLLLGSGFCLVSLICVSLNTSYLLAPAQCEFGMTSQDKGILNSVLFIGMMSSSHLWGFLADTLGRKRILVITICMDVVITIISSFAHTFAFFLFCRFLNGFFICGPSAVVYAYLGEFHSNANRTRVMMWAGSFIALGTICLPALAWVVIPQDWTVRMPWNTTFTSWRIFVVFCSFPSMFTAFILVACLTESPKFLLARGKTEQALKALRYVYSVNNGKPPETYPVQNIAMDPNEEVVHLTSVNKDDKYAFFKIMYDQTAPLFKTPYLFKTALACIIQLGLYTSCNGVLLWLPEIFNRQAEFAILHPNASATVCEIISELGNPLAATNGNAYLFSLIEGKEIHVNISNYNETINTAGNLALTTTSSEGVPDCVTRIDPASFQNTLIVGVGSACAYVAVAFLVNYVSKQLIIVVCLTVSAASGLGMLYVNTTLGITILASLYVVLSGMCISVLTSVVIDAFPTHLRAMAVCISLMFGRLGTVVGALLLGALLDINCTTVFLILSGIVFVCGVLAGFFPSSRKEKMFDVIP